MAMVAPGSISAKTKTKRAKAMRINETMRLNVARFSEMGAIMEVPRSIIIAVPAVDSIVLTVKVSDLNRVFAKRTVGPTIDAAIPPNIRTFISKSKTFDITSPLFVTSAAPFTDSTLSLRVISNLFMFSSRVIVIHRHIGQFELEFKLDFGNNSKISMQTFSLKNKS